MKTELFSKEISNWDGWAAVFQSIDDFLPLIEEIRRRESLPEGAIEHVTPGTNAVFASGSLIYKIYVPLTSSEKASTEFETERFSLHFAQAARVSSPQIIAAGALQDRYLFRYFVLSRLQGREAGGVLKTLSDAEKQRFVSELKKILAALNRPLPAGHPLSPAFCAGEGRDWDIFPPRILQELQSGNDWIPEADRGPGCYVHGDLTAENVLLSAEGLPLLIDFADSREAPSCYELSPLLFDLFDLDPVLLRLFCGTGDPVRLADSAFAGMLLHEFGASFAEILCSRLLDCKPDQLHSLSQLREALRSYFSRCCRVPGTKNQA